MNKEGFHHYSHGKLLISGEYFVLDGANALAVPTNPGQHFRAYSIKHKQSRVHWKSLDYDDRCWFEGKFLLDGTFYPSFLSDEPTGKRILQFLNAALKMAPEKMVGNAVEVQTSLEFNRAWGLGSSSTLVASFAKWLQIDPYELLHQTFGGSGYDVACADASGPILYNIRSTIPEIQPAVLDWDFKDHLFFAYLGRKQDSREGILHYRTNPAQQATLDRISGLTNDIAVASTLEEFMDLSDAHETIVSENVGLAKVKDRYFSDFIGSIKSLGAWGGDFVLAASSAPRDYIQKYFSSKGLETLFSWNDLILESNPS